MKKYQITGAILFALGFVMATGVENNPVQGLYALVLMGASYVCFARAERMEKREKVSEPKSIVPKKKAA